MPTLLQQAQNFISAPNRMELLRRKMQPKQQLLTSTNTDTFIFTEIYQCAKIGKIALESLALHHPQTIIHIFGTPADFALIDKRDTFVLHDLSNEQQILTNFLSAHLGTASLWAKLIIERPEKYLIHFDSDVIFRGQVFPDIVRSLSEGASFVGPRRNYQHNPNQRNDVRWLADVTQTVCFGFDRTRITKRPYHQLTKMCQGLYNPYGHPVIDFFDPVMFDILHNGGQASFLSEDDFGGCNQFGKRTNKYPEPNAIIDFGDKLAHFSAVGSGMNFIKNKEKITADVATTYINYAIEKYAIYCKIFYHEDIGVDYDQDKYRPLLAIRDWYNTDQV